jgi:hypothetical protein
MEPLLLVQVASLLLVVSVCSSPITWQRSNASGGLFDGMSPEDLGLRPANPMEELPPPDLIESPNKMLDPTPHDLNVTALRAMMGRNFDPQFMSITRPRYEAIFIASKFWYLFLSVTVINTSCVLKLPIFRTLNTPTHTQTIYSAHHVF